MEEKRNKEKHAHMLGKPFGALLDYWIDLFRVGDMISAAERSRMLLWITSKYDTTKISDGYTRLYFVRKVVLSASIRKGWINPYEDNIENNRTKESPEYTNQALREKPADSLDSSNGGQLPF